MPEAPTFPSQGKAQVGEGLGATATLTGVTVCQTQDRGGQLLQGKTGMSRPYHLLHLQKKSSQPTDHIMHIFTPTAPYKPGRMTQTQLFIASS